MPLLFTEGVAQNVIFGPGIGKLDDFTIALWLKLTSAIPSATRGLFQQGGGGHPNDINHNITTGNITNSRDYTGTDSNSTVTLASIGIKAGQPSMFARVAALAGPELIYGARGTDPIAEASSYVTQTTPVGTLNTSAANYWTLGTVATVTGMTVWMMGVFAAALDLRDLRQLQLKPGPKSARGCVGFWRFDSGTGKEVDRSGNNNHGTITGAIPVNDVFPGSALWGA